MGFSRDLIGIGQLYACTVVKGRHDKKNVEGRAEKERKKRNRKGETPKLALREAPGLLLDIPRFSNVEVFHNVRIWDCGED